MQLLSVVEDHFMRPNESSALTPGVMSHDHVVYVEDDHANRSLMASIFARHFPQVQLGLAGNGSEGLDSVMALRPCLVLLDGYLGDMTASEFVAALRLRSRSALPRILVVSGSLAPDTATGIIGVHSHVMKPFKIAELVDLVARLLSELSTE